MEQPFLRMFLDEGRRGLGWWGGELSGVGGVEGDRRGKGSEDRRWASLLVIDKIWIYKMNLIKSSHLQVRSVDGYIFRNISKSSTWAIDQCSLARAASRADGIRETLASQSSANVLDTWEDNTNAIRIGKSHSKGRAEGFKIQLPPPLVIIIKKEMPIN